MNNQVFSVSILLICSSAYCQGELGFGITIASRNNGNACTPIGFTMNEIGQMAFYNNPCSELGVVQPSTFKWEFKIVEPRFGSSNDTTYNFDPASEDMLGYINIYDIDHTSNPQGAVREWTLSTGQLEAGSDGLIVQSAVAMGTDTGGPVVRVGTENSFDTDEHTFIDFNADANTNGVYYNITDNVFKYWYPARNPFDSEHPNNSLPSGQTTILFGEVPESGYWVTLTNGAYLFDFSTETWTLKLSGGVATGASESGDFLVGLTGSNSFVMGPNSYFKAVSETGYTIELLDMNDLGYAVGKATDNTTLVAYPCAWSFADEVLNIYTDSDYEGHWLGLITDSGFGMYENDAGDKGAFTLLDYYNYHAENCPPDLNDDGHLDFFDLSAFFVLFHNGDAGADLSADGMLDFFDISAFVDLYNSGCSGYSPPSPLPEL